MNTVAAGLRADIHHRIANPLGEAGKNPLLVDQAERKSVDENVGVVASVEVTLAADGGHANAITIAADAGDHAGDKVAGARMIDGAKAQRIERSDGPRAHGENIAQDAADAGRRALVGLDERRMVVAFHLERHGKPFANINDPGILSRPLQNIRPFSGEVSQIDARALVAAVLRPHDREYAKLGVIGLAAEKLDDLAILIRIDAMARD